MRCWKCLDRNSRSGFAGVSGVPMAYQGSDETVFVSIGTLALAVPAEANFYQD